MKRLLVALCILCSSTAHATDPGMAGTLSIIPGLGQVANGDPLEGLGWFVSSLGLMASNGKYARDIGFKIWEYNMYDAYRDAGAPNAAKYSVLENYVAFLNPVNLVDPFSVGIIGFGALSATSSTDKRAHLGPSSRVQGAFFYGFVGLGEEGLFRGFLYPEFSSLFSSYVTGAVASSVLFSLSHLTNSQSYYHSGRGLGFLFIFGMLECWQVTYNDFDLRHSIFSHAWYDILVDYGKFGSAQGESQKLPDLGIKMSFAIY